MRTLTNRSTGAAGGASELHDDTAVGDTFGAVGGGLAGEARLTGLAARQWSARFDLPEDEMLQYRTELLNEPKLTPGTTLPSRL